MITRSKSFNDRFYNWYIVPQNQRRPENKFNYQSAIKHLKKNYLNPKSGISFSGVSRIHEFHNQEIHAIPVCLLVLPSDFKTFFPHLAEEIERALVVCVLAEGKKLNHVL